MHESYRLPVFYLHFKRKFFEERYEKKTVPGNRQKKKGGKLNASQIAGRHFNDNKKKSWVKDFKWRSIHLFSHAGFSLNVPWQP